jgi:hypothetical protein
LRNSLNSIFYWSLGFRYNFSFMRIQYLLYVYGRMSFRICDPLHYRWHSTIKIQLGCINSWTGIFLLSVLESYTDEFLLPWHKRAVFIALILSCITPEITTRNQITLLQFHAPVISTANVQFHYLCCRQNTVYIFVGIYESSSKANGSPIQYNTQVNWVQDTSLSLNARRHLALSCILVPFYYINDQFRSITLTTASVV